MDTVFFLHQIKRANGIIDKGIVVKESFEAAKQGYHAYLGAYAYGHDQTCDYVQASITDMAGNQLLGETWIAPEE